MIRGIVFDLFNTLVPGGDYGRAATVRRMGAELGVDPDKFAKNFIESWRDRMTGALGGLEAQCRTFAGRLGANPTDEQVARAVEIRLEFDRKTMVIRPDVLETLRTLRADGAKLAIVSNCTPDIGIAIAETPLVDAVDAVVLSFAVGIGKPDPRIYEIALADIELEPEECVYVGDGADHELDGAAALGMYVCQTTQFSNIHRGWRGPKITNLDQLPALLSQRQLSDPRG